ncbi:MAG TPA: ABC transporter permease [Acidobacteriota bacterium]|nr:ABC transporter permease [Acidobacteriota bacterium]
MSTPSNPTPDTPLDDRITAHGPATQPLYWSVRRELWENRSIYIAPLVSATLVPLGLFISRFCPVNPASAPSAADPAKQGSALVTPYSYAAWLLILTAFIVGVFYCLDALHGERRDRSIVFWKSLPVSDLTAVLSKASIPLAVLPALTFVLILVTQPLMLLTSSLVLRADGLSAATRWAQLPLLHMSLALPYALTIIALWHAPLYGWLLLVSGWARRAAFLWAVLPPLAIMVVEKVAFNSSHLASLLQYRLFGGLTQAFAVSPSGGGSADPLVSQLTPGRFFATPGLWLGLGIAGLFLFAAVRLRRQGRPI